MDEYAKTATPEENAQTKTDPAGDPAGDGTAAKTQTAASEPKADAADQQPPAGQTYTEAQLAELREQWRQEDAQAQAAQQDFEKMTPEQQAEKRLQDQAAETERLKAELADRDLTDYARAKVSDAQLPAEALPFVKGKDQADTDAKVKAFQELLAAGIQAGVEKRFKDNGYTPRGTAASNSGDKSAQKQRGVSVNPGK